MQKNFGIPWGISEAAFNLKDFNNNYQYKSFGVPWLGLKRGLEDDMVVSPYSVFLSLNYVPNKAIDNLRRLEKEEMYDKYGFYESIDYTIPRLKYGKRYETVKTYMAHHQALSLLAINNFINRNILVKRFMNNPEIEAVDILLQERTPEKAIITKEKKEKIQKVKPKDYQNYIEKTYTKIEDRLNVANTISNGNYTVCTKQNGEGFSKYNGILINRFKETADYKQGILFYIKDVASKRIWVNTPIDRENRGDKYVVSFAPERSKFVRIDADIESTTKIIVSPDDPVEIRRLELKNNGTQERTLEITNYFEPVLSRPMQDYAHMAFNNLFLTFERLENDNILVKRKKRGQNEKDLYLGTSFYTEHDTIGELEIEIDKEKFLGKKQNLIPEMVKDSKPYSQNMGLVTDSCLASKRTIKIMPGEEIILDLVICISNDKDIVSKLLEKYRNTNVITKTFELARAKVEAESIYLRFRGTDIEKYQKLLSYIILNNPLKSLTLKQLPKRVYSQSNLWKYGISGDLPIILLKIEDLNDMYVVRDALKAHEYFRSKNIKADLVILNGEENSYDQYVNYEIENAILNNQVEYLKNISGGIFVININQIDKEDIELLEFKSNIIINAKDGDIKTAIDDLEEAYLKTIRDIGLDVKPEYIVQEDINTNQNVDMNSLKYYNEYGGFSEDGLEYTIKLDKENKLPTVWSMILANPNFGTVVTQNLGGFTWHKNSRLNRLSAWNNNPVMDLPSEIIYLKDYKTGEKWSLSDNINNEANESYITYGMGYVKFKSIQNNISQELDIFVPREDSIKINILKLKNLEPNKRRLKLVYYIKPVLRRG
jgi:cellobiose phosphorylase